MQPFLRFFVAAVLLFAALAKTHQLATVPTLPQDGWFGFLETRWVQVFVITFEIFWAKVLIFNPFPRLIWRGTTVLFVAFAAVSAAKWVLGEASCGCFGRMEINPLYTAIFDAVVVGMLVLCRKHAAQDVEQPARKCVIAAFAWLAVSLLVLFVVNSVHKSTLSLLGTEFIDADGWKTVMLEPEKWHDKEFPLLPYIESLDVQEKMKTGTWTVILYHRDCPKCHEVMHKVASEGVPNVVCVEIPPYGVGRALPKGLEPARLTDHFAWFVKTPVVAEVRNGTVSSVWSGLKMSK